MYNSVVKLDVTAELNGYFALIPHSPYQAALGGPGGVGVGVVRHQYPTWYGSLMVFRCLVARRRGPLRLSASLEHTRCRVWDSRSF